MRWLAPTLISCLALTATPARAFKTAQVCVRRDENNGAMNVFASQLTLRGSSRRAGERRLSLIGGETKCVDVEPGRWSVEARSGRPQEPAAHDTVECRSNTLRLNARAGRTYEIELEPRGRGAEYVCGWRLGLLSR